ncbi:hypothetical protein BDR26DRAFT_659164 [Obelidium mucronatum]|nr:hypothetical protein BDR26DRAFT_659164 [Obelidium mucronatum]
MCFIFSFFCELFVLNWEYTLVTIFVSTYSFLSRDATRTHCKLQTENTLSMSASTNAASGAGRRTPLGALVAALLSLSLSPLAPPPPPPRSPSPLSKARALPPLPPLLPEREYSAVQAATPAIAIQTATTASTVVLPTEVWIRVVCFVPNLLPFSRACSAAKSFLEHPHVRHLWLIARYGLPLALYGGLVHYPRLMSEEICQMLLTAGANVCVRVKSPFCFSHLIIIIIIIKRFPDSWSNWASTTSTRESTLAPPCF